MRNGMAVNPIWSIYIPQSFWLCCLCAHPRLTEKSWMIKLKSFNLLFIASKNPKCYRLYTEPTKPDESLEILIFPPNLLILRRMKLSLRNLNLMTTQFQSSRSTGLTECITPQTVLVNGLVTIPVVSTLLTIYANQKTWMKLFLVHMSWNGSVRVSVSDGERYLGCSGVPKRKKSYRQQVGVQS